MVHKFQGRAPSGRTFNEIALDHQGEILFQLEQALYLINSTINFLIQIIIIIR